jgi:hypothetical protein
MIKHVGDEASFITDIQHLVVSAIAVTDEVRSFVDGSAF